MRRAILGHQVDEGVRGGKLMKVLVDKGCVDVQERGGGSEE